MSKHKDYLGDGVYADFDGNAVILTAEDGIQVTAGPIHLDQSVMAALAEYAARMTEAQAKG